MSRMVALVTGAAGFIGSTLVDALLARGAQVIGVDNFTEFYPRARKRRNLAAAFTSNQFTLIEADIERAPLATVLPNVTHVFHLAGQPGVRPSWGTQFDAYLRHNVAATQQLLEACVGRRLERFVFASTSAVYGAAPAPMREDARPQPLSPYGVTKLAAEHLCHLYQRAHGVPIVALRYFTAYGPRQRPDMAFHRFLSCVIDDDRTIQIFGDGDQVREFTYVADVVSATIAAAHMGRVGATYNIGGGSQVSVNDAVRLIAHLTGRPITIESHPAPAGEMRITAADTTAAERELGLEPSVNLHQGLNAQLMWHLSELETAQ